MIGVWAEAIPWSTGLTGPNTNTIPNTNTGTKGKPTLECSANSVKYFYKLKRLSLKKKAFYVSGTGY